MRKIFVGTRDSQLAVWQAQYVVGELSKSCRQNGHGDSIDFEMIRIKSKGDLITDVPFEKLEGKGFFTKELDMALLSKKIDIAVHSLKDIPTEIVEGLSISAVTRRNDPRDAFISHEKGRNIKSIKNLPKGAVIATGSLRRKSQLLVYRPDLKIIGLRGNLQTRYKKLESSDWHGMILASAGVERLNLSHTIAEKISSKIMLPAVGQGSLAIMSREKDDQIRQILIDMDDPTARIASIVERSFLSTVGGGCTSPIACHCQVETEKNQIQVEAFIGAPNGEKFIREGITSSIEEKEAVGRKLAKQMLSQTAIHLCPLG